MRATNRTWPFMPWTREASFRPRPEEAPGTGLSLARPERSRRRFARRLRDPHRAPGSCSPPIPRWACLTRRGPVGEGARRVAAAVGVREAVEARAALAAGVRAALAAGVRAVVVEQAARVAAVARVVAGAREVRVAERVVEAPAE